MKQCHKHEVLQKYEVECPQCAELSKFKKGDIIRAVKGPLTGAHGSIRLTDGKEALLSCGGRNAGTVVFLEHCIKTNGG